MGTVREIRPQAGPQERFLSSPADIAIFGGSAGGGKSFSLLMEPLRHINNQAFGAVIFRRTYPQITNEGGLWDESRDLYTLLGAEPKQTTLEWRFPSGASVSFAHLQHDADVQNWYGAQIPLIEWDEVTQFSERAFWFMLSRNRSTCGVRPYIRASCNPDADSWVARLIEWWIDQETGYPIPERSGVLRWFVRDSGELVWSNSRDELARKFPGTEPKSLTFVPAKLTDNPALMKKDPGYLANLMALPYVERARLLDGNWKIRPAVGLVFPRIKWGECDAVPQDARFCRYWDKAGTEGGKGARTAGVLVAEKEGRFYVVDAVMGRWGDLEREETIRATAELDRQLYGRVRTGVEQEPGSGGKDSALATIRRLSGFEVFADRATGEKSLRWKPFACQVQAGNVYLVKGNWDWAGYVQELDSLSGDPSLDKGKLKDLADASSAAFKELTKWSPTPKYTGPVIIDLSPNWRDTEVPDIDKLQPIGAPEDENEWARQLQADREARLALLAAQLDGDE